MRDGQVMLEGWHRGPGLQTGGGRGQLAVRGRPGRGGGEVHPVLSTGPAPWPLHRSLALQSLIGSLLCELALSRRSPFPESCWMHEGILEQCPAGQEPGGLVGVAAAQGPGDVA